LRTIPGVGPITALTWALEIGDVSRFKSIKQAISYCGLCSAEKSSADKPDSNAHLQQRNKHIQQTLVEAANWLLDTAMSWLWFMRGNDREGTETERRLP
jgi:transposase